jgi:hypothetical protein
VDRCITELMLPPEEAYRSFIKTIENVNVIIATYNDPVLGDISIEPTRGNMAMGSGLHQWGFTLKKFAKMYAAKFQTSRYKMIRKLWGDAFYNKKGEWKRGDYTQDSTFKRGFVGMCLEPIYQLFQVRQAPRAATRTCARARASEHALARLRVRALARSRAPLPRPRRPSRPFPSPRRAWRTTARSTTRCSASSASCSRPRSASSRARRS